MRNSQRTGIAGSKPFERVLSCSLWTLAATIFIWTTPSAAEQASSHGAEVYLQARCFACHGQLGHGGAGPSFRGNKLIAADTYMVGQILVGRGIMPSFEDKLSDEDIAAVVTYIRTSWGNDLSPVTPERVDEIRKSLSKQDSPKASQ